MPVPARTPLGALSSTNCVQSTDTAVKAAVAAVAASREVTASAKQSTPPINSVLLSPDHLVTLCSELGEGGNGTVYLGHSSKRPGTYMAVKMVGHGGDADEIADIKREVAAHQHLFSTDHPSNRLLVQLYHYHHESVRSLLLLELVNAHIELEDYVEQQPQSRIVEASAKPLAAQLAEAVARCHSMHVAHLDIQPRNVLVSADGKTLKLIDYGASVVCQEGSRSCCSSQGAAVFGSVMPPRPAELVEADGWVTETGGCANYRAPERQLADHALVGEDVRFYAQSADVFALGCTYFYMLTGRDAFDFDAEEESHDDLLDQIECGEVHTISIRSKSFEHHGQHQQVYNACQLLLLTLTHVLCTVCVLRCRSGGRWGWHLPPS